MAKPKLIPGKALSNTSQSPVENRVVNSTIYFIQSTDTRSVNNPPEWYMTNYAMKTVGEFKSASTIGLTGNYWQVFTTVPWRDSSGGYPNQVAFSNGKLMIRVGTSATTWSAWTGTGVDIQVATSQPASQSTGDFWYQRT